MIFENFFLNLVSKNKFIYFFYKVLNKKIKSHNLLFILFYFYFINIPSKQHQKSREQKCSQCILLNSLLAIPPKIEKMIHQCFSFLLLQTTHPLDNQISKKIKDLWILNHLTQICFLMHLGIMRKFI